MTDQTTTAPLEDDTEFPPVRFALRNMNGEAAEIQLRQHTLGFDRHILIKTGEDAFEVEGSHLSMDDVAVALGVVLASALQSGHVTDDIRACVATLFDDEDDE